MSGRLLLCAKWQTFLCCHMPWIRSPNASRQTQYRWRAPRRKNTELHKSWQGALKSTIKFSLLEFEAEYFKLRSQMWLTLGKELLLEELSCHPEKQQQEDLGVWAGGEPDCSASARVLTGGGFSCRGSITAESIHLDPKPSPAGLLECWLARDWQAQNPRGSRSPS